MSEFIENNLKKPLVDILPILQERITGVTTYFGVPTYKNPFDFWVYQEIVFEKKPDVVIEIGNLFGGSALALAHLFDHLDHGRVVAVDKSHKKIYEIVKNHPRIVFIEGDACNVFDKVQERLSPDEHVLIIEDSSHTFDNTLQVLKTYSPLLKPGDYFIVEDGICHHGLAVGPTPGPYEAVEEFMINNPDFKIDRDKESFLITWNPKGYLRKI